MSLQLEKKDALPNGKLIVNAYRNSLPSAQGTSFGRIQSPSNRVTISNLSALIADRNPGIQPAMVAFVARLLHEETLRQLRDGKSVEVLGLGTAFIATKGSMKGLKPGLADVPKIILKFKASQGAKTHLQGISAKAVVAVEVKPVINTVIDMKTKKVNELKSGTVVQIKGYKLRVEGNKPEVGLYLVKSDGTKIKIQQDNIIRNEPSTLEFILPNTATPAFYTIEVRNQSKSKDVFSNNLRVGISEFKIEVKA